jgi:RND family efflux transporter MFP subunit
MTHARHALLVASLLTLAGCSSAEKADEAAKPIALVSTAVIARAQLNETLTAFGTTEFAPAGERSLTAPTEATVEAVLVSPGAEVAAGQPLLKLKPSPQAELDLQKAVSDLEVADRALKRTQRLRASGLAADGDVEAARAARVTAAAVHASLEQRTAAMRELRAPAAGVVESLAVAPGDQLAQGAALGRIGALGALRVRLGLDGSDARRVRAGAVVRLSGLGGEALGEGRVSAIEPRIDPQTRLAAVLVTTSAHLAAGQPVKGDVALARADGPAAPRAAVVHDADAASVFVVDRGVAHKRPVKLGPEQGDRIAILDGVKAGERVVVDGAAVLEDGMAVREGPPAGGDGKPGETTGGKPDAP